MSTATEQQDEPAVLTISAAARRLSVSTKSIYRLIASGTLPAYRVASSRTFRLRRDDVDALLEPVRSVGESVPRPSPPTPSRQ